MEKECFKCGGVYPLSGFYKHPAMPDGHVNKCKECNKQDVRENRKTNIDYYRGYDKRRAMRPDRVKARTLYQKTEAGKQSSARARKRWTGKNPIKVGAKNIVNNAVRDGKLIKPSACECCEQTPKRLHGHHDDYAHPLIVRWLCTPCHFKWHKENGEGKNAS